MNTISKQAFTQKIHLVISVLVVIPTAVIYGFEANVFPIFNIFAIPLTHRDRILQKIKSGSSHITYHTSHITYCM